MRSWLWKYLRKNIPGKGKSKDKSPKVESGLTHPEKNRENNSGNNKTKTTTKTGVAGVREQRGEC